MRNIIIYFLKCNLGLIFKLTYAATIFYSCARRGDTRGLFRRHTALQGALIQAEFDTSVYNSTSEELFNHLRDDIVDAIESQIQLNG